MSSAETPGSFEDPQSGKILKAKRPVGPLGRSRRASGAEDPLDPELFEGI